MPNLKRIFKQAYAYTTLETQSGGILKTELKTSSEIIKPGQAPQRFLNNLREFPEEYEPWRINYSGNGFLLFALSLGVLSKIISLLLL